MSVAILRPWFILSSFFFVLTNGGEVQTKKETGKVTWSMKSPCKQCIHIAMCPVICGKKIPTTPQPKPTIKPPPTKLPPTFPPTPRPPTTIPPPTLPPPTRPGTTKSPPVTSRPPTQPPLTPAPPVIPSPQPPAPPTQPPPLTPAPPVIPPPVTPGPPVTPAPPIQPPSPTPAPPVQPPSPTPAPPIQPPSPTPVPPVQPPPTPAPPVQPPSPTPAPPVQPGELSCPIVVEKKGCFKDDQKPPRPLPNYILTDRDSSLTIYSGQGVDWGNWVNYLPDFVCRCAQLAKSKNFKFFGIQYYGECWSGPSQDESSFKEDRSSTECVNTDWKECSDQSKFACAGKQFNNYVYAIVS